MTTTTDHAEALRKIVSATNVELDRITNDDEYRRATHRRDTIRAAATEIDNLRGDRAAYRHRAAGLAECLNRRTEELAAAEDTIAILTAERDKLATELADAIHVLELRESTHP